MLGNLYYTASANEYSVEFLKKGFLYYYENGVKVKCDRIVFKDFQYRPSVNNYYFEIRLDNKKKKNFSGCYIPNSSSDTLVLYQYPYDLPSSDYCGSLNYFIREN